MSVFLILLIYLLMNVFFYFTGAYSRKYIVLIKNNNLNCNVFFCTLSIRKVYNNCVKVLFLAF